RVSATSPRHCLRDKVMAVGINDREGHSETAPCWRTCSAPEQIRAGLISPIPRYFPAFRLEASPVLDTGHSATPRLEVGGKHVPAGPPTGGGGPSPERLLPVGHQGGRRRESCPDAWPSGRWPRCAGTNSVIPRAAGRRG